MKEDIGHIDMILEHDRIRAELAIQKANEAKAFYQFAKERPDLNNQANTDIIRAHHDGEPITLESIRESVRFLETNHKGALSYKNAKRIFNDEQQRIADEQKAQQEAEQARRITEDKERISLWNQISRLLKVSDAMRDGEHKKYLLKTPKGDWIHPTEAMRTRLKTLQETSIFRGTTTEQLRQHLRSQHEKVKTPTFTDKNGVVFPVLPKDISATQIRVMWDAAQLRNAMKKYGNEQITKRLQEE